MAAPPRHRRVPIEDFDAAPAWFQRFLSVFNEFATDAGNALAGQLTRSENLRGALKAITFDTKAVVANTFPIIVRHGLPAAPNAVWVGRIEPLTTGDVVTSAVAIVWDNSTAEELRITYVTGLAASKRYRLTLVMES